MSEKLTAFERALLQQFEALAAVSESALNNSEDVSEKLRELGSNMKVTFDQLARRQSALEQRQKTLIEALDVQTKAHRGLEGAIRELGKASERTADRTQEMTRERGQRDWDRAMRSPSRGMER